VWRALLGVEKTVVEEIEFEDDGDDEGSDGDRGGGLLVAHVRIAGSARDRCDICRRRCGRYNAGQGRRRWRALDLGTVQVVLEADAPRVSCRQHGVVVAHVPWARHSAGHTLAFDQTVAWLATQTSKSAVTALMRIAWRTVGSIISRVWADVEKLGDRPDGLAGSGSTRFPTSAGIGSSPSSLITIRGGWCGPRPAGTGRRWAASSTSSVPNVAC